MTETLQQIHGINDSLPGMEVHESRTRPENAVLLKAELGRIDGSVSTTYPELWIASSGPLRVDALIRAIARILRAVNHDSSERVAGLVLALYLVTSSRRDRNAQGLANFFHQVIDADAEILFIIPALERITANFQLGSFTLERTDLHRLKDLCRRVDCDYADRYGASLEGTQCIRSGAIPSRIFAKSLLRDHNQLRYRVYDEYMGAVAHGIRQAVARAFSIETALLSIASGWHFPLERLLRLSPMKTIALFRERAYKNSRGWVVPSTPGFTLVHSTDFWPMGAEEAQKWAESATGRLNPQDDMPAWIHSPARLTVAAMSHAGGDESDLAGLVATTAIELLLAEGSRDIQRTVVQLGACVWRHARISESVLDEERIKSLYDARSKFVHEGKTILSADSLDLVMLARAVVRVAARAAAASKLPRGLAHADWLQKLKAVQTSEQAKIAVDAVVLRSVGLID